MPLHGEVVLSLARLKQLGPVDHDAAQVTAGAGERHPEAAGFLGVPIKLDVSVPAAQWVRLASEAAAVITDVDPGAQVITFGHVADGNVHVNIVPAAPADGRHENAVFSLVASLGGSISAEHGIGALKARWLPLARTDAERAVFARIRSAFDPSATLNPNVLPRLCGVEGLVVGGADRILTACPNRRGSLLDNSPATGHRRHGWTANGGREGEPRSVRTK